MSNEKNAVKDFLNTTGEYWAKNNAEYEKGDHGVMRDLVRALGPEYFGSAVGHGYTSYNREDGPGMALAGLEAMPLLGKMKSIPVAGKGLIKPSVQLAFDLAKLGTNTAKNLAYGEAADTNEDFRVRGFNPLETMYQSMFEHMNGYGK